MLDAPGLRDDYYCTVLAYCQISRTIAVGLANRVYLWSEENGVRHPPSDADCRSDTYVTSVSFSSSTGKHCVLATGRSTGQLTLWSPLDSQDQVRFQVKQSYAIACLAFSPLQTRRHSSHFGLDRATESLLVGDEIGHVYFYSVEWLDPTQVDIHGWIGNMQLLAKIEAHSQQICGLAWSLDGKCFATGSNDNACSLFRVADVFSPALSRSRASDSRHQPQKASLSSPSDIITPSCMISQKTETPGQNGVVLARQGCELFRWRHAAAVKAIAFCPWQSSLLATGGGTNDRAIHFYHVTSGACLASINVYAQVTALVWSATRREIAATFGYAQPEHAYRVAVFSWPQCKQVFAIPWTSDLRALYAVPYPICPPGSSTDTKSDACLVVACSDESVKFHQVWSSRRSNTSTIDLLPTLSGSLGGNGILEALDGHDNVPDSIR